MDYGLPSFCWRNNMSYKFERLEVWQLAVEYIDLIYTIAELLPK